MLGYILHKVKLKYLFLALAVVSGGFYLFQLVPFTTRNSNGYPVIVWWTPFMWENEKLITCSSNKYNCVLTKDRKYINNTNLQAFLFYGSSFDLSDLPLPKTKEIWAVFHEESPRNVAVFLYQRTFELFEITSTFSRRSDFPLTLQYLNDLSYITDTKYVVSLKEKNRLLTSIAPVLYIQSDCDTPHNRDAYVRELMKYVQVDSFGTCLQNKNFSENMSKINPLDLFNEELLHFVAKYKFVIALENAICDDYITEKLWRPLMVGTIPIYLGSPSVEDWLPNKYSAILVKNYPNVRQLADYINKVNTNDHLYEIYRQHKNGKIENDLLKNTFADGDFGIGTDQISGFECFVCKSIHEGVLRHNWKNVYNCLKPNNSSWDYYWDTGDCESRMLVDVVKNNGKFIPDLC